MEGRRGAIDRQTVDVPILFSAVNLGTASSSGSSEFRRSKRDRGAR
jgi:hypothetical protein